MSDQPLSASTSNPPAIPTISYWRVGDAPDEGANYIIDLYWFERTQKRAWVVRRLAGQQEEWIANNCDGGREADCLAAAQAAIDAFQAGLIAASKDAKRQG